MRALKWSLLGLLVLAVYGLLFLSFAPGYDLFFVRSESMKPNINVGDIVVTGPVNGVLTGAVRTGEVITFELETKTRITHRVLAVKGEQIITKGDALEDPDPFTITQSQVRGIYMFKIPFVGYLTSFIRTKTGWFISIIIPATLLVGWIVKDIVKEALKST